LFLCKPVKSARGIASRSRGSAQPRSASDDWRHMRPTPAELEVARALIARVKAADPSIKRVDELLVWAIVACRADELGGVPRRFALGRWTRNISRPKQVTDWVARLIEKLEQMLAAESMQQRLARAASLDREECAGQTFAPPIHWSGQSWPASVRFSAYSRQTEAGVARALISRLKAAEFLALRGGC
jgi:hypothetical protein